MSRDDSILYTGVTSAEPKTPREAQRKAKEEAYLKLKPGYVFVLDELKKEKEAVIDLRSFVVGDSEEVVRDDLRARKLYLGYLNALEAKITQIMKRGSKK
jgi:hypothetical protein